MSDTNSHDPISGLVPTVEVSIDGAAFVASTNTAVEIGSGLYAVDLVATELNGDMITLRFSAMTADDRMISIITQE